MVHCCKGYKFTIFENFLYYHILCVCAIPTYRVYTDSTIHTILDLSCTVKIRLFSDSLCQPTDSTAAIVGGVVAALFAVFVVTVIILAVVFVAVRRSNRRSDKHSG